MDTEHAMYCTNDEHFKDGQKKNGEWTKMNNEHAKNWRRTGTKQMLSRIIKYQLHTFIKKYGSTS